MSDQEKPTAKGTPSWQRFEASDTSNPAGQAPQGSNEQTAPADRSSLIEKATKFLEDDDIRDAPIERKQYFLESKGLNENEIRDLIQRQPTAEAEVAEGFQPEQQDVSQVESPRQDSNGSSNPASTTSARDITPVITYPEFLIHSQKPPPLVTTQRLLTALYVAFGAAATIYGTSKYTVEPMVETLTSARHSLFDAASTNLSTLNEKLEKSVSKIPETSLNPDNYDLDSIDSGSARFFNRSAATQTTPHLSRSTSSNSSDPSDTPSSPSSAHEAVLSTIKSRLSDLLPADAEASSPVKDSIDELQKYLDGLACGGLLSLDAKGDKLKEDAVAKVKSEIRGVKGMLLSARNFPSGVSVR
ncbi:hypothetical protein OEA41_006398 [Lepraria neglecta]|uniref:Peroxisomal membrane protein PEX14 n=1 Tax=Lepraria neglecta TaxID=209136 RepID=A0AAD9Z7J6_9LECA|nr:hypothetical protein OEA41_006398 [Lepraria neglecta]